VREGLAGCWKTNCGHRDAESQSRIKTGRGRIHWHFWSISIGFSLWLWCLCGRFFFFQQPVRFPGSRLQTVWPHKDTPFDDHGPDIDDAMRPKPARIPRIFPSRMPATIAFGKTALWIYGIIPKLILAKPR